MSKLEKSVVLVGLMGSGKSSVGRRLAASLGVEFVDVDEEIEKAADRAISEIFAEYGEEEFRALETRVLSRLLEGAPMIIATGGGAFASPQNRDLIGQSAVSVWIDADLETLWERVRDKTHRPLLLNDDPKGTLAALLEKRAPDYARADLKVHSTLGKPHEFVIAQILQALGIDHDFA